MVELCSPALIYVAFSLVQIIIDTYQGLYNTALIKTIVMIIITILLNILCSRGMGIISWIIVFIPFILMSVIVAILLYVFGLDPYTGKTNVICKNKNQNGNLIFVSTPNNKSTKNNKNVKYIDVTYGETPLDNSSVPFWKTDYEFE